MQLHNFNAGPCHLPEEVVRQASEAVLNFENTGLSLLEIPHRGSEFKKVMEEARSLARELMNLEDDFEVLFLHGGGRTQFMELAMNLLDPAKKAAYINTGTWSTKALEEARLYGNAVEIASSKDKNFSYIPKEYIIPEDAAYLHITTNNTIFGTEYQEIPDSPVPLIADMSSNILSRNLDFNKFSLIYAGAQKNLGAAGVTMVAVRKSILGKVAHPVPVIMDYNVHIDYESMYNTPPVFAVYVCLLNLRWLKKQGGVRAIEKINIEKARLLYNEIERNPLFEGTVAPADRSRMNVCFVMEQKELEPEFMDYCKEQGLLNIKGHRSVGGFRVSLYNAITVEEVELLVEAMKHFEQAKG